MDGNPIESGSKTDTLENLLDFIKRFDEINDRCAKTRELYSFVKLFLEGTEETDSDQKHALFVKLVSKIPGLFEETLNSDDHSEIKNQVVEKNSKLQASMLCLETILLCLKNTKIVELQLLLFQNSLIVLYNGYNHCKDCESLYGNLLEKFKDQLANFFNKIQDVQSAMLSEFDELLKNKLHSSLFHLIIPISSDLYGLCELVFNIDTTIAKELYKRLVELFENYKEIGQADLKIDSILAALISEISSVGNKFKIIIKNKEQVHVSDSKIFLFKINLMRKIVSIFPGCMKENLQLITHLNLDLYDLLITCYHHMAGEPSETPLENILIRTIIPMLALFSSENAFISYVLLLNFKDISSDLHIPHLLLKLSTLGISHYKEVQDEIPEKKKIFWNLVSMLQANNPEDDLKFVSIKIPLSSLLYGRRFQADHQSDSASEDRLFTLYHHIYITLAEYSKKISDTELEELESFLMDILHSSTSNLVSLLISDIWMYRLRCSSVENLFVRCISFSQKLFRMPSNNPAKLVLKRMTKFLPSDYKDRLLKHDVLLKAFFCEPNKVLHRYGAPQWKSDSCVKENEISKKISQLLDELKKPVFNDNQQLVFKACCILELCAVSIDAMNIADFLRITKFATLVFKSEIYEIQITILTFLRRLNYKKFNDKDPQFSEVRSNLATLYNEALRSKNYVIRLEAFSLFYTMAQFTDIRITQETIAKFPDLYPEVKAYVSEIPLSGFLTEKDKMQNLEKQLSTVANKPVPSIAITDQSKRILSLLLPS